MAHQKPSSGTSAQVPDPKISDELRDQPATLGQDKEQVPEQALAQAQPQGSVSASAQTQAPVQAQIPPMSYANPGATMPYGEPGVMPGSMQPTPGMPGMLGTPSTPGVQGRPEMQDNRPFLVKSADGRIMVRMPATEMQNPQYYGMPNAAAYPGTYPQSPQVPQAPNYPVYNAPGAPFNAPSGSVEPAGTSRIESNVASGVGSAGSVGSARFGAVGNAVNAGASNVSSSASPSMASSANLNPNSSLTPGASLAGATVAGGGVAGGAVAGGMVAGTGGAGNGGIGGAGNGGGLSAGNGTNYSAYGSGMSDYRNFNQPEKWYDSLAVHILLVAVISLLLLIPNMFFGLVLDDRQSNQEYAVRSMTSAWGSEQDVGDPELVIPICIPTQINQYSDGSSRSVEYKDRYIRAKSASSNITINSERRFKGNYEATLYTLDVKQEGVFDLKSAMDKLTADSLIDIVYNKEVSLVFSVKDNKGIDEVKEILINGQPFEASPCDEYVGFEVRIPAQMVYEADKLEFSAHYLVRGSQSVNFYANAQVSDIMFSSDGANPNFTGAYLPRERNVDLEKRSFTAHYFQNNLSTGQPMISGYLLDESHNRDNVITIELFEDADSYVLINRLTKYVLLFIAMTFVTVLAFEIISKRLVSLVQYVVIGVALILFYLVLLSLSEHISFTVAYILGALVLSCMIALYIKAMFNSKKHALCLLIMLWAMYAVLFAIVHVEAYALLVGTILLVLMLGVVMYITRHLNQSKQA